DELASLAFASGLTVSGAATLRLPMDASRTPARRDQTLRQFAARATLNALSVDALAATCSRRAW
ncbi:MAG: hypothetical protein QOH53_1348, partial [Ilumatobacteraceae bacterium]